MNAKELAELLDGREYGNETLPEFEAAAKRDNLLIVFGYSDDNMELRGFEHDEVCCYDGGSCRIDCKGLQPHWNDGDAKEKDEAMEYFRRSKLPAIEIRAIWCPEDGSGASWKFETDAEHETFRIMEDGELFCIGIVVDMNFMLG